MVVAKVFSFAFAVAFLAQSSIVSASEITGILTDPKLLEALSIRAEYIDSESNVAFAVVNTLQKEALVRKAHTMKKCAGFEALPVPQTPTQEEITRLFEEFPVQRLRDAKFAALGQPAGVIAKNPTVVAAVAKVSENNIKNFVTWASSFGDRYYQGNSPNAAVTELKKKVEDIVLASGRTAQVDLIRHIGIQQNSLRVRVLGTTRPTEVVVLGGHFDSINQYGQFFPLPAPGADDNASGSADILEALRIVLSEAPLERTVDFFWYAGEEGGLLGSAEIAKDYKAQNVDVVGVLQLDMTLFPGAGTFTLGSMTDFTSLWMRNYLVDLNTAYIGAKIVDDKCGYGCSDHASWHRSGYPAIMPFEATFNGMNHNLHTDKDVIDTKSNFSHAAMFAKIAVALALELGNSTARSP